MRVLICGDRNWKDTEAIARCVKALGPGTTVIHGAARGADGIAGEIAERRAMAVEAYPADWNQYGKSAGPIRNRQMMKEGKPTLVVFFHNNLKQSKGTKDMVEVATKAGIPAINGRSVTDWPRAFEMYQSIENEAREERLRVHRENEESYSRHQP